MSDQDLECLPRVEECLQYLLRLAPPRGRVGLSPAPAAGAPALFVLVLLLHELMEQGHEAFRGKGYATEAAQAMVDYAFTSLNVRRIVLNTGADNFASMRVMERLGMTVLRNPLDMPGMAVIGVLENPAGHPSAAYMTACARPSPALDRTVTSGAKPCRRSLDPSRAALHPQADIPYHRRRP
jgi:hypothetical protein